VVGKGNRALILEDINDVKKNREAEMAKLKKNVTIKAPVEKVFFYAGDS